MGRRTVRFFLGSSLTLGAVACSAVLNFDGLEDAGAPGGDGAAPDGAHGDSSGDDSTGSDVVGADSPNPDDSGLDGPPPGDGGCGDTTMDPQNCGACGHSCLGGACMMSQCQPTLIYTAAGTEKITSIRVQGSDVFFTTGPAKTIARMGLDGTGHVNLVTRQYPTIGIASSATNLFWLEGSAGIAPFLISAPLAGTPQTQIDRCIFGARAQNDMALTGTELYMAGGSEVARAPSMGGSGCSGFFSTSAAVLGVAVSSTEIYFTTATELWSASIASPTPKTLVVGLTGAYGVALDGASTFFLETSMSNVRISQWTAAATKTIFQSSALSGGGADDLAVDSTSFYFVLGETAVYRLAR